MKKLIITCSLFVAASAASFAQTVQSSGTTRNATMVKTTKGSPTAESIAERRAKVQQQQLKLTPDQYTSIYNAELNYAKQEQWMKDNNVQPGSGQAVQMGMGKDQAYKNTLTAEQYSKYDGAKAKTTAPATK